MNSDDHSDSTNRPIYLNNEATSFAAVFYGTAPAPTVPAIAIAAASNIVPDAHIPLSGGNQHTNPLSPVNMKKMDKKDTINTTPSPNARTAAPANASARSYDLTFSISPYSLRNPKISTSSISTQKTSKKKKRKEEKRREEKRKKEKWW